MKLYAFAVFDAQVNAYMPPFWARAKGEAIRQFTDACSQDGSPFKRYPQDFRLFAVAEFDDASGELRGFKPEPVIGATEVAVGPPLAP